VSILANPFPARATANGTRFDVPYRNSLGVDFMLGSGTITGYSNTPRMIQFQMRILF
jgi:hypothetical protein